MRGVLLAFLCCLSRELKICPMGRSAEFILANKEELTTFFLLYMQLFLVTRGDVQGSMTPFSSWAVCRIVFLGYSQTADKDARGPLGEVESLHPALGLSRHKFCCSQTHLDS